MKKRNSLILLIAACLLAITSACDEGLRIVGIKIVSYPEKLVYVASVDDSLNLDGGRFQFLHAEKTQSSTFDMDDEREVSVIHEIDFAKEGVYTVTLVRGECTATFPVQVISIETLEGLLHGEGK